MSAGAPDVEDVFTAEELAVVGRWLDSVRVGTSMNELRVYVWVTRDSRYAAREIFGFNPHSAVLKALELMRELAKPVSGDPA